MWRARSVVWCLCALGAAGCESDKSAPADGAGSDTLASDTLVPSDGAELAPETTAPDTATRPPDSAEDTVGSDEETRVEDAPEVEAEIASEVETEPETAGDTAPDEVAEETRESETEGEVGDTSEPDTAVPVYDCAENVGLQPAFETLTGFSGSEDFAFDALGNRYSIDDMGNLIREHHDGSAALVLPGVSNFAAGMAILPGGDLIIADAEKNSIVRVTVNDDPVTLQVLLGGLSYPNGLDVDADDYIYVAEQNAGRVRQIDARDGSSTIIATGLTNPNGVSFGPGYRRLYIGSFGGGTVTALDRDSDGHWGEPYVYFTIPAITPPPDLDLCIHQPPEAWCYTTASQGGKCEQTESGLTCVPGEEPLLALCHGHNNGDACHVRIQDVDHAGVCSTMDFGVVCYIDEPIDAGCKDKPVGVPCFGFVWGSPIVGTCHDAAQAPPEWGLPASGMACINESMWSQRGGMDGLNVDACGAVYATEYIQGLVWRFDPGASEAIIAASLPSQWIPNLHWGVAGDWERTTLYVSDRDQGRVFGLPLGRPGKQVTIDW